MAELIPNDIKAIFCDASIIKVGLGLFKDIKNDFEPSGINFRSVLDLKKPLKKLVPQLYSADPEPIARCGLGAMAVRIYSYSYKPDTKKYINSCKLRTFLIYNWPINPTSHHVSYLINDARFVFAMLLDVILRSRVTAASPMVALHNYWDTVAEHPTSL
jgi:hypothetical protein